MGNFCNSVNINMFDKTDQECRRYEKNKVFMVVLVFSDFQRYHSFNS